MAAAQRKRAFLDAKAAVLDVLTDQAASEKNHRLVTDAVARYLRDVKMNKSSSTHRHYRHTLSLFKQSLTKGSIEEINRDDLMDFQEFLSALTLSPSSAFLAV